MAGYGQRRRKDAARFARHVLARAFAVLSLLAVFNLAAAPLVQAAAPPPASVEQLAADLKATFGDAFQLCVNVGDDGAPPNAPMHHGDGDCPLCYVHAAAALAPPDVAKPPPPPRLGANTVAYTAFEFAPPPPARASPAQPRAPPAKS